MKQCYPKVPIFLALFTLIFYLSGSVQAQCNCSDGSAPITEQHTYSTNFSSNSTTKFNIPKFDPGTGTLICVNAKVYLTSVLRMKLENDEVFNIDYTVRYQRKDTFSGPGISPDVVGSRNKNYGPYSLAGTDGNPFSGPDFVSIGPDTIYNMKLYEATTSDVVPYLGTGSVDFYYKSIVNTFAIGSDVYALAVTSQNKVDFVMTYSYCNTVLLAMNIKNFQAALKDDHDIDVSWITENEIKTNNYEIEVSENGGPFHTIGTKQSATSDGAAAKYSYSYHFDQPLTGKYYFRIKQLDGKTARYSEIRTISQGISTSATVNIYPNPVVRNINMQFDEPMSGDFNIELVNQSGQVVHHEKVRLFNNIRLELKMNNPPAPGIYFMRARKAGSSKVYSGKLLFRR